MSEAGPTPNLNGSAKFFISEPGSEPSTRDSSPAPGIRNYAQNGGSHDHPFEKSTVIDVDTSPGVLSEDVYDSALTWWRAGVRRTVVRSLKIESRWLAAMQSRVRTNWLDAYFVYTSSLGTHTFFMMLLPALFFLGHDKTGLGLVTIVGMGGYWCSFAKDLVCAPRPFSPPVTRLTIGNHHLEYGFPSTHSTNSASVALYVHTLIYRLYVSSTISSTTLHLVQAALAWYMFSIVFGRLYCGMHSISDCVVGVLLGSAVCLTHAFFEKSIEYWLLTSGWLVPLTLIFLAIVMINQHPQPVDDCPCFEDAIAFLSSIMGVMLGKWHAAYFGLKQGGFWTSFAPAGDWNLWTVWLSFAGLRLFFGVLSIFVWRLVAKAVFHAVLPPTFRFAAHIFTLPNRRFYTPATDYEHVPAERGLHPIPSVIDLPHSPVLAEASASLPRVGGEGLKLRNGGAAGSKISPFRANGSLNMVVENSGDDEPDNQGGGRKHYDADVLTKVMVYTGIGMIASEWGPVLFDFLGWTVVSG